MENQNFFDALKDLNLSPSRSGKFIRIPAVWRGGKNRNVAVHSASGTWTDHATEEKGNWRQLLDLIQTSPAHNFDDIDKTRAVRFGKHSGKSGSALADSLLKIAIPVNLPPDLEFHGLSGNEKRRKVAAQQKRKAAHAEAFRIVRAHFQKRLPGISPDAALKSFAEAATGAIRVDRNKVQFVTPVFVRHGDGQIARHGAHVTNLIEADGEVRKDAEVKSITPGRTGGAGFILVSSKPIADKSIEIAAGKTYFVVAEGLETTLSGVAGTGFDGLMAIDALGVERLLQPLPGEQTSAIAESLRKKNAGLLVMADRDPSNRGQIAGARLVRQAHEIGIDARLILPPAPFGEKIDWNDVHQVAGLAGLRGAILVALGDAEAEFDQWIAVAENQPAAHRCGDERIRDASEPAEMRAPRVSLHDAESKVKDTINCFFSTGDTIKNKPILLAVDPGVGKSQAFADAVFAEQQRDYGQHASVVVTPTNALADEAAEKANSLRRHGRTDMENDEGHCLIFPEVSPFSEKRRSVVAHKCQNCEHGKAAMARLRNEPTGGIEPCRHVIHMAEVRNAAAVTTSAAGFEGDSGIDKRQNAGKRQVVLDDTSALHASFSLRPDQIGQWIRAGRWSIEMDRRSGDPGRIERSEVTERLVVQLGAISALVADHHGEDQVALKKPDWTAFLDAAHSKKIDLLDATAAEAVRIGQDGELEVPIRAIRNLAVAIERETAWLRKNHLIFSVPTKQSDTIIRGGALVADATPSLAVAEIVRIAGGTVHEVRVEQNNLKVVQIIDGGHGKTACSPSAPSFRREFERCEAEFLRKIEQHGLHRVALLTHKSLAAELIQKHLSWKGHVGWWGAHNRGQNNWKNKACLVLWGVPQLSPAAAEHQYESDRRAVVDACNEYSFDIPAAWASDWDGAREKRWVKVPGLSKEIQVDAYVNQHIDRWSRGWTTGEVVQAIGRLRATRRDEPMLVEIHANFALTEDFGLEIDDIRRGEFRSLGDYRADLQSDQQKRALIAAEAIRQSDKQVSIRAVNSTLSDMGLPTIRHEAWAKLKGVSASEYTYFTCENTLDVLVETAEIEAAMRLLKDEANEIGESIGYQAELWLQYPVSLPEFIAASIVIACGGEPEPPPRK